MTNPLDHDPYYQQECDGRDMMWWQAEDSQHREWMEDYCKHSEDKTMDMTKYSQSDSKDLKAAEFIGKNLKVIISAVEIRDYPASEGRPANSKPALSFKGKDKTLVLNASNTKILCDAYGADSNSWLGHEIGLSVKDYSDKGFGHGWVVTPLDVAPPTFNDEIPF